MITTAIFDIYVFKSKKTEETMEVDIEFIIENGIPIDEDGDDMELTAVKKWDGTKHVSFDKTIVFAI